MDAPLKKFVEIEWTDAKSDPSWKSPGDPLVKPVESLSRGWLVEEAVDYLTVCGSVNADGDVSDCISIPMGMVQNLRELP